MAKPLIYDKTITIRVTAKKHKRYMEYCRKYDISLNQLTRYVLDKVTSNIDVDIIESIMKDKAKNIEKLIEISNDIREDEEIDNINIMIE